MKYVKEFSMKSVVLYVINGDSDWLGPRPIWNKNFEF